MIAIGRLRFLNLLNCAQNWHKSRKKLAKNACGGGKIATAAVSAIVRQLNFGIWRHRKIICVVAPFSYPLSCDKGRDNPLSAPPYRAGY